MTFGYGRKILQLATQKTNRHLAKAPFIRHDQWPTTGSVDLCWLIETPIDTDTLPIANPQYSASDGSRATDRGNGPTVSLYLREAVGHLIGLFNAISEGRRLDH